MTLRIEGAVASGGRIAAGAVAVDDDGCVAPAGERATRTIALPAGWVVSPGFVDLQVNGFAGAEVGDDPGALAAVAAALPAVGVTAFCPTLVTRDAAGYRAAGRAIGTARAPAGAARILGAHLEGPFLNPARAGAHRPARMATPSPASVDALLSHLSPAIVTLAPELDGALDAIARLAGRGIVVAVGHTEADAARGRRAIDAGARLLTHAFNAMPALHHRRPSVLAAFLADAAASVGLIADGVHVAPEVAAVAARAAGPRLVLVSDAVSAARAPEGEHMVGGRRVWSDGTRVTTADGRLAGSAAGLDTGPRTLAGAGIAPAAALAAASDAPRALLGLPHGLTPGVPADLVVLDAGLVPRLTLVGGVAAYCDPALPFDPPAGTRA